MKNKLHRRLSLFLILFIGWGGIIIVRLVNIMVMQRDFYVERFENESWRIGHLPAIRGRLLNPSGTPISWSIRYYSLYYQPPKDLSQLSTDLVKLNEIITFDENELRSRCLADEVLVKEPLTPEELMKLRDLMRRNNRLVIRTSFKRQLSYENTTLLTMIGQTTLIDQHEVGVSGWEKKYDRFLAGRDGKYKVMVDKSGNWIPETWREIQSPVPGNDVIVQIDPQ